MPELSLWSEALSGQLRRSQNRRSKSGSVFAARLFFVVVVGGELLQVFRLKHRVAIQAAHL